MKVRRSPLVVVLLVLAACADGPTGSGDGTPFEHAMGSDDVLVKVTIGGGLVSPDVNLTNLPVFALYGDGTVITPGAQIEIYPAPALPEISTRSVDETGVQTILSEAIDAVDDLPADLDDTGDFQVIADAPTTTITVDAGRSRRTVEVFALELTERPAGIADDVYEARQGLLRLIADLGNLEPWLPAGSLGDETMYEANAARIFVGKYRSVADLHQEPIAWPLGSLSGLADSTHPAAYRCTTLEGRDWIRVRDEAARANQLTPWTDGADRFSVLFRPLLPDESGC
jgi:hypothetical protein